mmetsp:Transcript_146519/g.470028  ORF Transcript_146519/g.470028 Transcript_146519/m.470028 type:complete len:510 (+) Transcript_146519:335-1864(+)
MRLQPPSSVSQTEDACFVPNIPSSALLELGSLILVCLLGLLLHLSADPPHVLDTGLAGLLLLRRLVLLPLQDDVGELNDGADLVLILRGLVPLLERLHCRSGLLDDFNLADPARAIGNVAQGGEHGLAIPSPRLVFALLAIRALILHLLLLLPLFDNGLGLLDHAGHIVELALHGLVQRVQLPNLLLLRFDVLIKEFIVQLGMALNLLLVQLANVLFLPVLSGKELLELRRRGRQLRGGRGARGGGRLPTLVAVGLLIIVLCSLRLHRHPLRMHDLEVGQVRQVDVLRRGGTPEHELLVVRGLPAQDVLKPIILDLLVLVRAVQRPKQRRLLLVLGRLKCELGQVHLHRRLNHRAGGAAALAGAAYPPQMLVVVVAVLREVAIPFQLGLPILLLFSVFFFFSVEVLVEVPEVRLLVRERLGVLARPRRHRRELSLREARAPRVAGLHEGLQHERRSIFVVVVLRPADEAEVPHLPRRSVLPKLAARRHGRRMWREGKTKTKNGITDLAS